MKNVSYLANSGSIYDRESTRTNEDLQVRLSKFKSIAEQIFAMCPDASIVRISPVDVLVKKLDDLKRVDIEIVMSGDDYDRLDVKGLVEEIITDEFPSVKTNIYSQLLSKPILSGFTILRREYPKELLIENDELKAFFSRVIEDNKEVYVPSDFCPKSNNLILIPCPNVNSILSYEEQIQGIANEVCSSLKIKSISEYKENLTDYIFLVYAPSEDVFSIDLVKVMPENVCVES